MCESGVHFIDQRDWHTFRPTLQEYKLWSLHYDSKNRLLLFFAVEISMRAYLNFYRALGLPFFPPTHHTPHTQSNKYTHTHTCMNICFHVRTCTHVYNLHTHTCTHAHKHTHSAWQKYSNIIDSDIFIAVRVLDDTSVHVCARVCMYVMKEVL